MGLFAHPEHGLSYPVLYLLVISILSHDSLLVCSAPKYISDVISKLFITPNVVYRSGSSGWLYSDTVKTGSLGGACDTEKRHYSGALDPCLDPNGECFEGRCFCKNGSLPFQFRLPGSEQLINGINMCFADEGQACQPELLEKSLDDKDQILTEKKNFEKLIEVNKAKFEVFQVNATILFPDPKRRDPILDEYLNEISKLEEFGEQGGMVGKSSEHWSCASGNCTDGKCVPGTNPLLHALGLEFKTTSGQSSLRGGGESKIFKILLIAGLGLTIQS